MMTRFVLAAVVVVGGAVSAAAQESPLQQRTPNTLTAPAEVLVPRATLKDMAWFAGRWTGNGLGGATDESWSAPAGGAMMGMFRLLKIAPDAVHFNGLTFGRVGNDTLEIFLAIRNPDGAVREERFTMRRIP